MGITRDPPCCRTPVSDLGRPLAGERRHRADQGLDHLPRDLETVDWILVFFESSWASASVVIYDVGTCRVDYDSDSEDPADEIPTEPEKHVGDLDVEGVFATLERVVATLVAEAVGHGTGVLDSPPVPHLGPALVRVGR